jgi:hypothetical protein
VHVEKRRHAIGDGRAPEAEHQCFAQDETGKTTGNWTVGYGLVRAEIFPGNLSTVNKNEEDKRRFRDGFFTILHRSQKVANTWMSDLLSNYTSLHVLGHQ